VSISAEAGPAPWPWFSAPRLVIPRMCGDQLHHVGPSNTTVVDSSPKECSERIRPPRSIHTRQRSSRSSGMGGCDSSGEYVAVSRATDPEGWLPSSAAKWRSKTSLARALWRHWRPTARKVFQRGSASWRSSRTSPRFPMLMSLRRPLAQEAQTRGCRRGPWYEPRRHPCQGGGRLTYRAAVSDLCSRRSRRRCTDHRAGRTRCRTHPSRRSARAGDRNC
jgi:hypothetical protein